MILKGADRVQERRFILDGAFPHFPMLPVKRDTADGLECGMIAWQFVKEGDDLPVKVYLANLVAVQINASGKSWKEALEGVPTVDYLSLDAFFDAGWRGD